MVSNNKINILHNIAYENQLFTNPFIMRSVLHNVNANNASILAQGAESNATVRLTFSIKLLMISNNVQLP